MIVWCESVVVVLGLEDLCGCSVVSLDWLLLEVLLVE